MVYILYDELKDLIKLILTTLRLVEMEVLCWPPETITKKIAKTKRMIWLWLIS